MNSPYDSISWSASVDGTFSIKSVVLSIQDHQSQPNFKRQQLALGSSNIRWVRWEPPYDGWIKLNSDGAAVNNSHYGACSGVFKNHHGNFLLAFSHRFDSNSPLEAELSGILKGLHLAWQYQCYNLIVEVDCAHDIRLINSGCQDPHPLKNLIDPIQSILTRHWCVHFPHVLREANQPADRMAAFGLQQTISDCVFNEIPPFLSLSLAVDSRGTWFSRSV
ncbi:Ribonuclease H domain [Sesbania bispinosa]|nr:Ribonuclease H domain [Sesbania bispinosa]